MSTPILILIVIIQFFIILHNVERANMAWRIASERDDRIRQLEQYILAHLPPEDPQRIALEEAEAEVEALMKKYETQEGAFS